MAAIIHIYTGFPALPVFLSFPVVVCHVDYLSQSYARAYIRAYTRTCTGIFR